MASNMRSMGKANTRKPLQVAPIHVHLDSNQPKNDSEQVKTQKRLDEIERTFNRKMKESEERMEKVVQEKCSILHEDLRQKGQELKVQKSVMERMENEMKQLNERLLQLSAECDRLTKELAEKNKALQKSKQDQEILQKQLDLKTKELQISENERKKLQLLLDARTGTLQDLMGTMGTLLERIQISDDVSETNNIKDASDKKTQGAQVSKQTT